MTAPNSINRFGVSARHNIAIVPEPTANRQLNEDSGPIRAMTAPQGHDGGNGKTDRVGRLMGQG
jgi:hypothetical protein